MVAAQTACRCGSGLPFAECHADPRNEFARTQALREAEMIASLFPFVRVACAEIEAAVERIAASLPDDAPAADAGDIADLVELVPATERRRVVQSYAYPHDVQWRSLTAAAGDPIAAERSLVAGALQAEVAEHRPPPRAVVEKLEHPISRLDPVLTLTTVVPPMLVWSRTEAECGVVAGRGRRRAGRRLDAVESVGYAMLTGPHVRRARRLVARLAARLPVDGLPAASATLGKACDRVAADEEAAERATVALLMAYVEQLIAVGAVAM